jgi:hypothetical protein
MVVKIIFIIFTEKNLWIFFIKNFIKFFFNASPLPDFWKKSSGEACYARRGQNWAFWGATRGARSVNDDPIIIKIIALMMATCQSRCAG